MSTDIVRMRSSAATRERWRFVKRPQRRRDQLSSAIACNNTIMHAQTLDKEFFPSHTCRCLTVTVATRALDVRAGVFLSECVGVGAGLDGLH